MDRLCTVTLVPVNGRWNAVWQCVNCHSTNIAMCPGCLHPKHFEDRNGSVLATRCCGRVWRGHEDIVCCYCLPVSVSFPLSSFKGFVHRRFFWVGLRFSLRFGISVSQPGIQLHFHTISITFTALLLFTYINRLPSPL